MSSFTASLLFLLRSFVLRFASTHFLIHYFFTVGSTIPTAWFRECLVAHAALSSGLLIWNSWFYRLGSTHLYSYLHFIILSSHDVAVVLFVAEASIISSVVGEYTRRYAAGEFGCLSLLLRSILIVFVWPLRPLQIADQSELSSVSRFCTSQHATRRTTEPEIFVRGTSTAACG